MIRLIGDKLFQWDIGRQIGIRRVGNVTEVHFAKSGDTEALVIKPKEKDGLFFAEIPNILLQSGQNIIVYSVEDDITLESCTFKVTEREKPSDYIYTETERYTVEKMLEDALVAAKESGEFKGEKGDKGDRGPKGDTGEAGKDAVTDQTYDPKSENAQSGIAVEQAVAIAKKYTDDMVGEINSILSTLVTIEE